MSESGRFDQLMIGALVTIIGQEFKRRVTGAMRAHGFDDYRSTYDVVFMLIRPDGSRVTELAELAQVTRQSMSELVADLERRGYLERAPDPSDRRAVLVRRTTRGWQVNAIARAVVEQAQREWAAQLGEREYEQTLDALRRIAALIGPAWAGPGADPRALTPPASAVEAHPADPGLRDE